MLLRAVQAVALALRRALALLAPAAVVVRGLLARPPPQ